MQWVIRFIYAVCTDLVHYSAVKVLFEKFECSVKLLGSVGLRVLEFVLLSHSLVLMHSEGMVGEDLYSLQHLEVLEELAECSDVFLEIADAWDKDITEPERAIVSFEPLCSLKSLLVASLSKFKMPFRIDLLYVKKYEIDLFQ